MKKLLLATAVASAFGGPIAAMAADSPHTFTANVGLVSDYRFRGISQTFKEPAVQGGFDYSHASGFYLGTWASNVYGNGLAAGNPVYAGGSMEWDFYGGYKFEPIKDVTLDVGLLQYYYPNAEWLVASKTKFDYLEAYLGGTWKWLSAKYSYGLKDFFGLNANTNGATNCGVNSSGSFASGSVFYTAANAPNGCANANGNSKGSGYLDLTATFEIMDKTNLIAHVGHQSVKNYNNYAYTDWKLGITREWAGVTWGAAYIDTNAKDAFYSIVEPNGAGGQRGRKTGDGTLVLSVAKTF